MKKDIINIFDFDNVTTIGLHPSPGDIVITGRCFDEHEIVYNYLMNNNISCPVYFNPISLENRGEGTISARTSSGNHKAKIINLFIKNNVKIGSIFEDDPVQIDILKDKLINDHSTKVVLVDSQGTY